MPVFSATDSRPPPRYDPRGHLQVDGALSRVIQSPGGFVPAAPGTVGFESVRRSVWSRTNLGASAAIAACVTLLSAQSERQRRICLTP